LQLKITSACLPLSIPPSAWGRAVGSGPFFVFFFSSICVRVCVFSVIRFQRYTQEPACPRLDGWYGVVWCGVEYFYTVYVVRVCVLVCVCSCQCECECHCMSECVCVCICTCVYMSVYVCLCVYVCVYERTYVYVCMYICLCV
jgi:hypothetical protein